MAGQEVTFAPRNRSRSPRPNDTTAPERMIIKVRSVTGMILANIEMQTQDRCLLLKQKVSAALSICTCKFDLIADVHFMETHHSLHRYRAELSADKVVSLVLRSVDVTATSIAQLFQAHVCFKCMKEAGASAGHILQYLCNNNLDIDARAFRDAGFSLSELVQARRNNKHLRDATPPPKTTTLFDSQLQQAEYTADDFRNAGYRADQLIDNADCWDDSEMTLAESAWKETFAMFSPEQLKTAGYDINHLLPPQRTSTGLGPLDRLIERWARCFPSPLDPRQHLPEATQHKNSSLSDAAK